MATKRKAAAKTRTPARRRTRKTATAKKPAAPSIRNRIVELRQVPLAELLDNERNWRLHPFAQRRAIAESLEQIGISDALLGYHSERNGGALTLIDGHARKEETADHDLEWPVIVLDVNDEEADRLLLTLDPMTGMADADHQALTALLDDHQARVGTQALEDLLQTLREWADGAPPEVLEQLASEAPDVPEKVLPEMELQPYENYDYVVLLCRNTYDWMGLQDALKLEPVQVTAPNGSKRFGLGRVVDARKVLDLLKPPVSE